MTFTQENVIKLDAGGKIGMSEELITVQGSIIAANGNEFGLGDKVKGLLGREEGGRVGELGEEVVNSVDVLHVGECGVWRLSLWKR